MVTMGREKHPGWLCPGVGSLDFCEAVTWKT